MRDQVIIFYRNLDNIAIRARLTVLLILCWCGASVAAAETAVADGAVPETTSTTVNQPVKKSARRARKPIHNLTVGTNFVFPSATLSGRIYRTWAISVTASLYDYSPSDGKFFRGHGVLATLNYFSESYFRGMWLTGGGGYNQLRVQSGEIGSEFNSMSLLAAIGWRWREKSALNLGFAVGLQYFMRKEPLHDSDLSPVMPALLLDFGIML